MDKQKFVESSEDGAIVIPERLDRKMDRHIIDALFAIACYQGLPKSRTYIGYRRNRKLLEALGVPTETSRGELLSMMV